MQHILSIPIGKYTLALFHHCSSNGIFDKNFLGIPIERYGFSNNVDPMFSAPSYKSTVVEINKDMHIDIALVQ
ncbi:DUF2141 domain-containing protein [Aureispira]|nr:DUF2141 domain-containing protein [Aureispira sp.]